MLLRSNAEQRFRASDDGEYALVEEARRLMELACGNISGDARVYMSGIERQGTDTTVSFNYIVSGIPVESRQGGGASVTFSGSVVTEMKVQLTSFESMEQTYAVLPAAQAAAILPEGSELCMRYLDDGTNVRAGWWKEK